MNVGFGGHSRVFDCGEITINPDADPLLVAWPGNGSWNPNDYRCPDSPQPRPIEGLDGFPHLVFSAHAPALVCAVADYVTVNSDTQHSLVHGFGRAAPGSNQGLPFNGPQQAGVCCLMSNDGTPGGGGAGYAFFFDSTGILGSFVRLVQLTNGFDHSSAPESGTSYIELAAAPMGWPLGQLTTLTLTWYSDPISLKGTYLKASVGATVFCEIVHAGGAAHVLPGASEAGVFGCAFATSGALVIYHDG